MNIIENDYIKKLHGVKKIMCVALVAQAFSGSVYAALSAQSAGKSLSFWLSKPLSYVKQKPLQSTLVVAGAVALCAGIYWWWNRKPAKNEDVPGDGGIRRVTPGGGENNNNNNGENDEFCRHFHNLRRISQGNPNNNNKDSKNSPRLATAARCSIDERVMDLNNQKLAWSNSVLYESTKKILSNPSSDDNNNDNNQKIVFALYQIATMLNSDDAKCQALLHEFDNLGFGKFRGGDCRINDVDFRLCADQKKYEDACSKLSAFLEKLKAYAPKKIVMLEQQIAMVKASRA